MSFVTNSLGGVVNTAKNIISPQDASKGEQAEKKKTQDTESRSSQGQVQPPQSPSSNQESSSSQSGSGFMSGFTNAGKSVGNTVQTGFTSTSNYAQTGVQSGVNFTTDLAKGGAQLASDAARAGASISQTVAKSGLDMGTNVVGGTVDLAGTAIGGIVNTAAETSGKVFEPIASGLKSIEAFDKLGEGVEAINGLLVAAVKEVGAMAMKALNMSGKVPTFFDTDGNGVVNVADTTKGLIVLGLDEKNSKYAAYALHAIFSYPTGDAWVPTDTTLPINVSNMERTRWGKNWGQYDRIDWIQDVDIDQFFSASDDATWQEKFKKGRQYFGVLLLIFEWGTTWPFMMPNVPVEQIPFKDEIGKVVRKLLLPTILSNFQRARKGSIHAGSKPPAHEAPTDST
ncbi:hypothetical protein D9758_011720 [Tetrapyrgos nigripes]|uniref:Uncharacterized protein n=1 Tax=Tetrapyrgos nigripes TaxID=182062 RepID=A0A8H5LMM4_9AGAR|nr:hypothetical protein D9758_011720 [Tetrapyrgos nigripes]